MALIVLGVVLQQPPTSDAPISHHLFTYDTKSTSGTPVFFCDRTISEIEVTHIMIEVILYVVIRGDISTYRQKWQNGQV